MKDSDIQRCTCGAAVKVGQCFCAACSRAARESSEAVRAIAEREARRQPPMKDFSARNRFMVGRVAADMTIINPPASNEVLTKAEAVNLACWLLTLSGVDRSELVHALVAVESHQDGGAL